MANMQERLDAAVNKAEVDTGLLHTVVHGSKTTTVTTEGGKVPSVAKVLEDMRVRMEADQQILHSIANGTTTTVVQTENGTVPSAAKVINDARVSLNNEILIMHDIANGDANTVVHTENGNVPSAAKAIQDITNTIESGTNGLVTQAQNAAQTATTQATKSTTAANRAAVSEAAAQQYAVEAKAWANGTDAEVTALGGKHSAREWVELAEEKTKGCFPTTVTGVATENQTDLHLPEALVSIDQVLLVSVENLALMPDTYSLANGGQVVKLQYPLSENERWCVKYLNDFQSMGSDLDAVLYEDM